MDSIENLSSWPKSSTKITPTSTKQIESHISDDEDSVNLILSVELNQIEGIAKHSFENYWRLTMDSQVMSTNNKYNSVCSQCVLTLLKVVFANYFKPMRKFHKWQCRNLCNPFSATNPYELKILDLIHVIHHLSNSLAPFSLNKINGLQFAS